MISFILRLSVNRHGGGMLKPPKKRYVVLLVIALYIVLKFYIDLTSNMDDTSTPETVKDTVLTVVDSLYDY